MKRSTVAADDIFKNMPVGLEGKALDELWQRHVEWERQYHSDLALPGIAGRDGKSLARDDPRYAALTTAFRATTKDVLDHLARRPELVQQIHWRDFEELTAHFFAQAGFDVTLTTPGSDRGVDLYAARHTNLGSLLYVVECKRYRGDRPVGPGLVRQLRAVVEREGANAGVLATTSFFSKGARDEQRTIPFRIALQDLRDITRWFNGDPLF